MGAQKTVRGDARITRQKIRMVWPAPGCLNQRSPLPSGDIFKNPQAGGIWMAPNAIAHICGAVGQTCMGKQFTSSGELTPKRILSDIPPRPATCCAASPGLPGAHNTRTTAGPSHSTAARHGWCPSSTPSEPQPNRALIATLRTPRVRECRHDIGYDLFEPDHSTPEYLGKFVAAEIKKWAAATKASGFQPE
jgi:hypothetical protein